MIRNLLKLLFLGIFLFISITSLLITPNSWSLWQKSSSSSTQSISDLEKEEVKNDSLSDGPVESNKFLSVLYADAWYSGLLRSPFVSGLTQTLAGFFADSVVSKYYLSRFINVYKIDMSEAEKPLEEYKTLNDLFARHLRPGVRPIAKDGLVSPADGWLRVMRIDSLGKTLKVKDSTFCLPEFLGLCESELNDFYKGYVLIIRIEPHHYHRFHMPYEGTVCFPQKIHGVYESVHPIAFSKNVCPLTCNERSRIPVRLNARKNLYIVPVGAMFVGSILYSTPEGDKTHKQLGKNRSEYAPLYKIRGEDLGTFAFGGSTVVLVIPYGTFQLDEIFHEAFVKEVPVKMGQRLGAMYGLTGFLNR